MFAYTAIALFVNNMPALSSFIKTELEKIFLYRVTISIKGRFLTQIKESFCVSELWRR